MIIRAKPFDFIPVVLTIAFFGKLQNIVQSCPRSVDNAKRHLTPYSHGWISKQYMQRLLTPASAHCEICALPLDDDGIYGPPGMDLCKRHHEMFYGVADILLSAPTSPKRRILTALNKFEQPSLL